MTLTDMSGERILVTGGAGFIGSRLVKALLSRGAAVHAYDNLLAQVHGAAPTIDLAAPLTRADIRDREALAATVADVKPTIVVHLAAETGTGQSADEPVRYSEVNVVGTANLVEALRNSAAPPRKVVLAATRAVYGEGAYRDGRGDVVAVEPRRAGDLAAGRFAVVDGDGRPLEAVPTPETLPVSPGSVYGSSKLMQEYLLKQAPGPWETVMLRLQNVYGPGQSLRNPYTGVLSIFCKQALEGRTLNIYEDGDIVRDFVYVDDVVSAFVAACAGDGAAGRTVNIGSGVASRILDAARLILGNLGLPDDRYQISGAFRAGDIRHAVADISLARSLLAWEPQVSLAEGIEALASWAKIQGADNL